MKMKLQKGVVCINITVYCGSSVGNSEAYARDALKLGEWIGKNGNTLVFGGGAGLMDKVYEGTTKNGGNAIAVQPANELIRTFMNTSVEQTIETDTMENRKQKLFDLADVIIALPGGMGTIDEFSGAAVLYQIGESKKPLVLFNTNGYYDIFIDFMKSMIEKGFMNKAILDFIIVTDDTQVLEERVKEILGAGA